MTVNYAGLNGVEGGAYNRGMYGTGRQQDEVPVAGIVVAAGRGTRMNGVKKQFVELGGYPMVVHALRAFESCGIVSSVVVVVPKEDVEYARDLIVRRYGLHKVTKVIPGGELRQNSVYLGLQGIPEGFEYVVIHDAARPAVTPELIERVVRGAERTGACAPGIRMTDTLRRVSDQGIGEEVVSRDRLWRIQTPQAFRRDVIMKAHEEALRRGITATDDSALVDALGIPVVICEGAETNLKVTTPEDLELMRAILASCREPPGDSHHEASQPALRAGIGYDVHRTSPGNGVTLAGVFIPCDIRLIGHSDADVICHGIMDALLGALGERDIGHHFPPGDDAYRDACSLEMLQEVGRLAAVRGYRVLNVDVMLNAEKPRIGKYVDRMKENVASALKIQPGDVGIKATTSEGLGFAGRGEGICCWAIVLLSRGGEGVAWR